MMGGEDFAYMLESRPGAYILVGNGDLEEQVRRMRILTLPKAGTSTAVIRQSRLLFSIPALTAAVWNMPGSASRRSALSRISAATSTIPATT